MVARARAEVVKEYNGLTHDGDNCGYQHRHQVATIPCLSAHLPSPNQQNGACYLIIPLKSSLSAVKAQPLGRLPVPALLRVHGPSPGK
jgi:hypothetical protein